jgi:hypothetical protein
MYICMLICILFMMCHLHRRGGVDRRQGAGAVSWLKAADQLIADRLAATKQGTADTNDVLDALIR